MSDNYETLRERELTLIRRLIDLTDAEKLTWAKETDWHFTAEARQSRFDIRSVDRDDVHPYALEIVRSGDQVASIVSRMPDTVEDDAVNAAMQALYRAAKRSATSLGPVVREVMRDLDAIEGPPF